MPDKRVLVCGGSGFLGSHVADALTDARYQVRIFDLIQSPYLRGGQEMVIGNLMDQRAVAKAAGGCSYIYNFAGIADIDDAGNRPVDTAAFNVVGNVHALEAARQAKAKRFIFASSVYVYSESGSFYRASKQAAERFVEAYHDRYGLSYTILRYGSLYGRRADERNGIYRLLKQALEQKRITYGGTGEALREYIHVSDAAKLSVKILEEEFANRHIILSGHERMPVKTLMKMVCEMIPGGVDLKFGDQRVDPHYDITPYAFHPKIGHKLVANDYVDLGQGIMDCLADIHERLHKDLHKDVGGDWLIVENDHKG